MIEETKRLFEGPCFEIISHALNLHREDIRSDEKLNKIIESSKDRITVDIDDLYYRKVKTIYSRIVEFGTRIPSIFSMDEEKVKGIYEIKVANRYMVEAIKDSRSLHSNITKYMASDNEFIREEYNQLRKKVSKVLTVCLPNR